MKAMKFFYCFLACGALAPSVLAGQFIVKNKLPGSSGCPNGNTITLFTGQSQPTIQPGGSLPITGDFSKLPGLGIQVNNWYWVATKMPVQSGNPQNPDNSGAQFAINSSCVITSKSAPWYGKGIPTYLIANVSAQVVSGKCIITIKNNSYTNAVTPGCCAPPGIGSKTCKSSQWGVTNDGKHWPPS